jgi:DNA polymerase-3 subunit gamma/tau
MAAQALYRKWRSQDFTEVVGQEHVTVTLRNALRDSRLSHAYLFTGPRGTGKTSTARILAKALNCLADDLANRPCNRCHICTAINESRQLDLIEIDAASNRGIDEMRDLREKIGFRPTEARYKVYIIDEVHMLTKEASNALLKTLEEPPPHAVFVLATTEPDRVPETVRSRCQRFDFRRIPTAEMVAHLEQILASEGRRAAPEALVAIARRATGSMRDAVSLLDQMLSYGDDVLELARVERVLGLVSAGAIGRLVGHMVAGEAAAGLTLINQSVAEGVELGQLTDQVVAYLRAVLFVRVAHLPELLDLPGDVVATIVRQAEAMTPAALLAAIREFTEARQALRDQVPGVPQLPLEMALLRAILPAAVPAPPVLAAAPPSAPPVVTAPVVSPPPAPEAAIPPRAGMASASGPVAPSQPSAAVSAAGAHPLANTESDLRHAAQAQWDRLLNAAGKSPGVKVQAALRSVREIEVVGQALVLRFSHAFARDLVGQGDNRARIEALWEELLGRKVQVRCALVGEAIAAAAAPAPLTAGARPANEEELFLQGARDLGAVVTRLA